MANTLDPMDLKQIIRLHIDGVSNRKTAGMLGISRNTVNSYISLFKACDHTFEELLEMDEPFLRELVPSHTTIVNERYNELMQFFEKEKMAREHPGFTFLYHYHEYKETAKDPYSYSQFMEHYKQKYGKIKGSMKLEHKAGHELFIDYAGKKLQIVDRETGEIQEVEVFVCILPHSQYTYVEASMSQKREDMLGSLSNALEYFGGVPKAIVSDNLKAAVTRSSKYEPVVNRSLKDFGRHYGCVINPTRSYSPQDKALVENAVNLVYQRIYYHIREIMFFSLEDLNKEIRKLLDKYNDLLLSRKEASRKELFQSVERGYLKPLPDEVFQIKEYRRAKVQKIGYVYFSPDKTYYSVPYRYIGKNTLIHYTRKTVEVYYNHQRIAMHKRRYEKGIYITVKDHLGSQHKAYTEYNVDYFVKKAAKHGHYVTECIKGVLSFGEYPETQYKRAMGIIQLHRSYGSDRLDTACKIAVEAGTFSYKKISNILKNNMDKVDTTNQMEIDFTTHIPKHINIRGANNYK
ncbi:MAG: IS21 family transposase [Bacteroidales bacterium]